MPKKRKSNSKRSPQGRPLPHKQVRATSVARARSSAPVEPSNGTSELRALAHAQRLTAPTRSPEPLAAPVRPASGAPVEDAAAPGTPAVYAVGATYWLKGDGDEATAAVQFVGTGLDGDSRGARFVRRVPVPDLPTGSGRASLTEVVRQLPAGRWRVEAQAVDQLERPVGVPQHQDVESKFWPFVRGPAVRPWAWSTLVLLGLVLAVSVQALLVSAEGLDARAAAFSAVAAAVTGFLAAKVGFMVVHRVPPSEFASAGTLIQVFLVGAFGSLAGFAWLVDLPLLQLLDLTAPGVFAAMALARPGCWLGGCCAGRPTASRWGLWSSDRRIGVRRVPVQLMESALAASVAMMALALVLAVDQRPFGVVLVLSASVYTLGRQLLFPLRTERRRTSRGRALTMAGASVATAASVTLLLVA